MLKEPMLFCVNTFHSWLNTSKDDERKYRGHQVVQILGVEHYNFFKTKSNLLLRFGRTKVEISFQLKLELATTFWPWNLLLTNPKNIWY